jgi:hypothetical protein
MSEWISVEERLPEHKQRVLVFYNNHFWVVEAWIQSDGMWFWPTGGYQKGIPPNHATHWMPLPDPPEATP